jgi:hypothetical protein
MYKLAVIHFSPIEKYPPVMNLLNYLSEYHKYIKAVTISTIPADKQLLFKAYDKEQISIKRKGISGKIAGFFRYITYMYFNIATLFELIVFKPRSVIYFETLSSWPALMYKKWVNPACKLYVHYHEYTTSEEYRSGMKLNRWFHKFEKAYYQNYNWISHTNEDRMSKFINDGNVFPKKIAHILPNYPPSSWGANCQKRTVGNVDGPIKLIYVGALSLETMYLMEFADWVQNQNGKIIWDIYSNNYSETALSYINSLNSNGRVNMKKPVDYYDLPLVLNNYQIGIILYKGHIENYIYNAPNKLFEYLSCGLDVWFPSQLVGSLPFVRENTSPRVVSLNFELLNTQVTTGLLKREGLPYKPVNYSCEEILNTLIKNFIEVTPTVN